MEFGNITSQESVPVVSKTEQKIQELTKDFSEPEMKDFLRNLDENTKKEIRDCYWENKRQKIEPTHIQSILASIEMEESKEDFGQMYGR